MQGYQPFKYAPSVADTMSVWSGPSVHGSIYGAGAQQKQEEYVAPMQIQKKPPVPKLVFQKPELKAGNPYGLTQQNLKSLNKPQTVQSKRRPMSQFGGSKKQAKATGEFPNMVPGMGPFLPQGAAKNVARGVWRGSKPKATGIFDAKTVFEPTKFAQMYHNGDLCCKVTLTIEEAQEDESGAPKQDANKPQTWHDSMLPGGRCLLWLSPPKHVNLKKYFGVFWTGLQEKGDPLNFMAEQGLKDLIDKCTIKSILLELRSIIYPIRDNLKTLDDDICSKTLQLMLRLARRSDKIAEAFIPHFPTILPALDILKNKQTVMSGQTKRPKSSVMEQRARPPKKLVDLKRTKPGQMSELILEVLEYFERHGGMYAFVTIKKLMPRYESVLFS